MKCSELQIGDYVFVKPSMMLIKIDAVHHKKVGYHAVTHKLNWVRMDLLEPITLTLEILERNGFVLKKKWAQKGNFGDNPLIMWHYDDDINTRDFKHELEIHQNDTGKVHVSIQCDYVHELQHALRLCRLNELPDNFKLDKD